MENAATADVKRELRNFVLAAGLAFFLNVVLAGRSFSRRRFCSLGQRGGWPCGGM